MHHPRSLLLLALLLGCDDGAPTPLDGGPPGSQDAGLVDAGPSDASSGPITAEACFADLSAPASGFIDIQRFRSTDDKVRVWRARQTIDAPTIGETFAFALVRFWIESDEEPGTCVRGKSALSYEYAHHNWNETWSAETDLAVYEASEVFLNEIDTDDRWQDGLSAKGKDGKLRWGPIDFEDDGCASLPYDLNACPSRTRSDKPPPGWGEE